MSKIKTMLLGGLAAAAVLTAPAMAAKSAFLNSLDWPNDVVVNQYNLNNVVSNAWLHAKWVGADLRVDSTAVGNNSLLTSDGTTRVFMGQRGNVDVAAYTNVVIDKGVGGNVDINTTAICNNAGHTNTGGLASSTVINQGCLKYDPLALTNVNLNMVLGDTSIASTAVANNISIDTQTEWTELNLQQVNAAATNAIVNAEIGTTAGSVAVNATAIGNNIVADIRSVRP